MKFRNYLIMLFLICAFSVSAQLLQRNGVVTNNIIFTTTDGETNNLYDLLNSGKHLFITSFKYPG